ncbi:MAG: glycosyltransferase, partial [Fimbriimonadaceae bacterium]|nr:glycosyltransferase [Chitinophagales bacterium]
VFRIIKKLFKVNNFIIHSFWLTDAAMAGHIINKKYNAKHICTCMGQDVKSDNRIFNFLDLDSITTITLSKNQDDVFFESTGKNADHIIPLPLPYIDTTIINKEKDIDILFVGSFIPVKHPELFISIMKKLQEEFPFIKAVMIGDGTLFENMKQIINAENLNDTIQLAGKLERKDVFDYMHRSKILLHTSEYEGQCLVFSEALAHGMYVVSGHVGRIEDSEKHIIGWSEEELFLKCKELLRADLRFHPYQSLDTNEIIEQYLAIYNS